ncbi:MAG: hypothetical protein ACREP2_00390 [Rhodanobacteraceae bacterium]
MYQRLESWVLLALAALQPLAGRLAQITGRGASIEQRADAARGPVTPAKSAFAIWGALFAGNLALAVRSFFRGCREGPANKWIAWLSSTAFAGNTAWSLQAQFAGLGWPSFGIISASAAAANAATILASRADEPSGFARFAANTMGPLAGWLTVATFANLDSTLIATGGRASRADASRRAVALVGAASLTAAGMAVATRGNLGYAAASAWGLGGVLLRNQQEARPAVARVAAAGLCTVALATLWSRRRSRT